MNSTQVELGIKADWFLMPSQTKELSRLVTSFGLSNLRLYAGEWSPEQLAALYSYSDAFVLPTKAEAWGLPLLEAAATGLPIITTYPLRNNVDGLRWQAIRHEYIATPGARRPYDVRTVSQKLHDLGRLIGFEDGPHNVRAFETLQPGVGEKPNIDTGARGRRQRSG